MSEKRLDAKNRWRNVVVAFRMSPEEAQELNVKVSLSGLSKQDYIIQCLLKHEIKVVGGMKVAKKVQVHLDTILEELQTLDEADRGIDVEEESYLSCAVRNICGNNLSDDMKPLYELCEYYRLIRNTSVHDLCEVDSHEKEYRKLQKYNFKTEAKFSKLVAPNKYEEISFDDFVMFSRSCVELAIYIFEKMAYDYTKIALDIPDKQISKWRKYSKNRQEKALCSYIKTLYKVDEEFIEQIPKLLNMIIDPIV